MLRVGKYVAYTPYSVVSGFMTGIGVIIMLIQVLPFIGLPTSTQGVLGTLDALAHPSALSIDAATLALAIACLALLIVWPRALQKLIPAPLVVLVLGTLAATFFV